MTPVSGPGREGIAKLVAAQQALPRRLQNFFIEYRNSLDEDLQADRRFEFRIELIQKRAPRSQADLAVSFVREDELSEEELKAYEGLEKTGRVVVRDRERQVANLRRFRPRVAAEMVEARIPSSSGTRRSFPPRGRR